jgi:peptide/nickel transport system substrate-binding protein
MGKHIRFVSFISILTVMGSFVFGCLNADAAERDVLRVALTSEPPNLSTCDHDSLISVGQNILSFNGLVRIDHTTLLPVLDLAESYKVENNVDWIFKLKKGVKFHNGDLFTAADVKATIEYAQTIPGSNLYTGRIKSVEVVDDYTVKMTTFEPYAGLLYDMGYHYNFILPKKLIASKHDFNKEPIGTGPYKLVDWNFGTSLTYEANEDYFDTEHKAKIKKLEFVVIPEGASRTIALEAGEVDFIWEVSGADVANLEANADVTVLKVDTVDNVQLFINNDVVPFDNVNVRNAINYGINRQDIVNGALNGFGVPNYTAIAMGYWGSTEKNAATYDPEKAKKLLAAWGGDLSTIKLPILCSNETRVSIATIIQSNLAKLGIKVEVIAMDTATYFAKWSGGDYVGVLASWSPSNSLTYVQRYHSERRNAYPGSCNNPKIDELVKEAEKTIDDEKRLSYILEIVSEANLTSPQISLYQSVWVRAYNAGLAGVVCSGTGYAGFNDMYWK